MLAAACFFSNCLYRADCVMCAGQFQIPGHGAVSVTNAGANTPGSTVGQLTVAGTTVTAFMNARTYFADSCSEGVYSNTKYSAMKLLGKKITFKTEIGDAGCGCNAAFYLVSMKQNPQISTCNDYYCDANSVCGVACAEVDIMEASKRAWHSTLHGAQDHSGVGGGYGGGSTWNGPRDFNSQQYGPGGSCIDTTKEFNVEAAFPVDGQGKLTAMVITLTQDGKSCPLKINLNSYPSMAEMSDALDAGMTPVISYWKSDDMLWMDGKGTDGQGPCATDGQQCGTSVKFYDFKVEPMAAPTPPGIPTMPPLPPFGTTAPPAIPPVVNVPTVAPVFPQFPQGAGGKCSNINEDCHQTKCCNTAGQTCYEKNQWWASCKPMCVPGIDPADTPENQQPWSCKPLGPKSTGTPATPPAYKEVVLKVPALGFPAGLGDGAEVILALGSQEFHAQVLHTGVWQPGSGTGGPSPGPSGNTGTPGSGGSGSSSALPLTLVVAGLALLGVGGYAHFKGQSESEGSDDQPLNERVTQGFQRMVDSARRTIDDLRGIEPPPPPQRTPRRDEERSSWWPVNNSPSEPSSPAGWFAGLTGGGGGTGAAGRGGGCGQQGTRSWGLQ